mmetsp:Transcript_21236/g.53440  ORF Transcript_21236/g.53440 Transcript_21236/m.53440 type:complete len:269 (-) Transcript_21236:1772-2578(-)
MIWPLICSSTGASCCPPTSFFSRAAISLATSALSASSSTFSKVPNGIATLWGSRTKDGSSATLLRTCWRLLLLPPRCDVENSVSMRTFLAHAAGLETVTALALAEAPPPETSPPATTLTDPASTVTVTAPVCLAISPKAASSWHVASRTFWLRARMAMWERMSIEERVMMAVIPGGMSSTPPMCLTKSTWGLSNDLPWIATMSSIADASPTAVLTPVTISQAPMLADSRALWSRAVSMRERAKPGIPRTTSSPKFVRYSSLVPRALPS